MGEKRGLAIVALVYSLLGCNAGPNVGPPKAAARTTGTSSASKPPVASAAPIQAVAVDLSLVSDPSSNLSGQVLVFVPETALATPELVVTDTTGAIVSKIDTVTAVPGGIAFRGPSPTSKPLVYRVTGTRNGQQTASGAIDASPLVAGQSPGSLITSPATSLAPQTAPAAAVGTSVGWTDVGAVGGYLVVLTMRSSTGAANVDREVWAVEVPKGTTSWTPGAKVPVTLIAGPAPLTAKTLYMVSVVSLDAHGWGVASSSASLAPGWFTTP